MAFQFEYELEKAAIPFLKKMHFLYSRQVPLHNRLVDLAAIDSEGNLICIEFKLKNWKRALKQAMINSNAFDYIYVCLPGGNYLDRLKKDAIKFGIGVMIFDNENSTIKIDLPAQRITKQWNPNVDYIRGYINIMGVN